MCDEFDFAIARPMRDITFGRPSVRRVHVTPPSVERHTPLFGPPSSNIHGRLVACHVEANSTSGLFGSITSAATPVLSSTNNVFVHVLPPSVVRNTPRSLFGPHACPCTPTSTMLGSAG